MSSRGERLYRGSKGKTPIEVKNLRGKYAGLGPYVCEESEIRLAVLREVLAEARVTGIIYAERIDAMIAKEGAKG